MTTFLRLSACVLILTGFCVVLAQPPAKPAQPQKLEIKNTQLLDLITARDKQMGRATTEPHSISDHAARACEPNDPARDKARSAANPHSGYAVHVYTTQAGREIMTTGQGVYPVGSVILKEKMRTLGAVNPAADNTANNRPNAAPARTNYTTDLYTGMLKREPGYNPECGDWEFFIVSGDAKKLLARGKIDSCSECHQAHKSTDYVTRAYMPVGK